MSTAERQMPEVIPYEWFKSNKENTPSIALLWINESQISTRPLSKLWVIKNELQLAGLRAINLQSQAVSPEALVKSDQQKKADKGRSNRRNDSPPNKIKLREMTLENTCPEGTSQLINADEWKAVYSAEEILKNAYHNTAGLNEVVTELKNLSSHGSRNYESHGPGSHNASIPYTLSENSFLFQQLGPWRSAKLLDCLANQIKDNFTTHPSIMSSNTFDFTVLGPASSDGLVAMLQDPLMDIKITSPVQSMPRVMEIYSPVASMNASNLLKEINKWENQDEYESAELIDKFFKSSGFTIFRTIPTDDKLIEVLKKELALRGITPLAKDGQIVVLSEADTMYGRTLANLVGTNSNPGTQSNSGAKNILLFNYFRGLDGEGANKSKSTEYRNTAKENSTKPHDSLDDFVQTVQPKSFEFAWGDDQIDYLRRIADELDNNKKVLAVGLLGSDVYDKLLILKALKPRFPSAIFFTTDLDARFFDGTIEPKFSRNMIVASGFGLQANSITGDSKDSFCMNQNGKKDHSGCNTIPSFRSSAQTAYFQTLSHILKDETKQNVKDSEIYEIGRTTAIPLGIEPSKNQDEQTIQSEPKQSKDQNITDIIKRTIKDSIAFCQKMLEKFRSSINSGQANNFHRYFAIALITLAFLVAARLLCQKIKCKTLKEYVTQVALWFVIPVALNGLLGFYVYHASKYDEPLASPLEGISLWPTEFVRLIAVMLGSYFWYRAWADPCPDSQSESRRRVNLLDWFRSNVVLFLLLLAFLLLVLELWKTHPQLTPVIPLLSIVLAILSDKLLAGKTDNTCENNNYKQNANKNLLQKSYVFALLISAISISLLLISSAPFVPYRGEFSKWADRVMLGMTVSVFLGLLATVLAKGVDLIGLMKHQKPISPHSIRTIAKQSQDYFGLAWYPFIIASLMLLSRSTIFDNWPMPIGLAIAFLLSFALLIGIVFRIRYIANQIRENILKKIPPDNKAIREKITGINQGAYAPVMIGPSVGGLALLAGGSSLPDLIAKLTSWLFG
jgi:Ca2+/Na+ antiporter